jgi:hypothetical protein
MTQAVSWDEAEHRVISSPRGRTLTRTSFIEPAALAAKAWKVEAGGGGGEEDGPQAILAQYPTPEVIEAHFHRTDQFQIVVEGGGRIGQRAYDPVSVQYTDGYTPYTITPAPAGISFFVLRARADTGAYPMPQMKAMKEGKGGRGPVSRVVPPGEAPASGHVLVEELLGPEPDGMRALMLRAGPGAAPAGPSAAESAGQFYVLTRGSVQYGGRELPTWSVFWVGLKDPAPELVAGARGCDVVVTQFPRKSPAAAG